MSKIQQWEAECIWQAKATLAEGPCWLLDRQALLWVDIESCEVHCLDPARGQDQLWKLPCHVGVAVPTRRGDFLTATRDGFMRLDPETGQTTAIADPESDRPGNRFNDGKCDPQGRFWAGTLSYQRIPNSAALYRLDPDLSVHRMLTGVTTSNGMAWSMDGRTMYYIDTPTRRVDAFDFDPEAGTISNRRTVLEIPESLGKPDGMTIDEEGMLWVALWGGWGVGRWNPRTGQLLGKVAVPAERTSSCCFGGSDLSTLFITTARTGLSPDALEQQPLAGSIFAVDTGHRGLAPVAFAG
ncbi:MAG: regucalcin-like protein [Pirellulaceae bacterium]|nr:MAG: regucalcin-like protein [Pirellulaceae bacterium]